MTFVVVDFQWFFFDNSNTLQLMLLLPQSSSTTINNNKKLNNDDFYICRLYDKYSFNMIPAMGQVVAGDWKSYQYLVESIRKFPDQVILMELFC